MQIRLILCILLDYLLHVARHVDVGREVRTCRSRPTIGSNTLEVLVLLAERRLVQRWHQRLHSGLLEDSGPGRRLQWNSRLSVLDDARLRVEVPFQARVRRVLLGSRCVDLRVLEALHLQGVVSSVYARWTVQICHRTLCVRIFVR